MTWSEFLAAQLDRARSITLAVIEDFDDRDFYTKVEHINPGIWILGHMANSEPSIVFAALGEPVPRPEYWADYFSLGSKLLSDLAEYPPLSEVRQVMEEGHSKTQERIKKLSDQELIAPVHSDMKVFPWLKTVRDALGFAVIHECNHSGQLMLLRKLLGKSGLI